MRPYRHIPTADLVSWRDDSFRKIQWLIIGHHTSALVRPVRRELARLQRELDRRSEEAK
jgi:hypothetical protein